MPSTLTAHEQAISKIFSDDYVFKIPSYQRPYAWKTEQAQDLIDDLLGYMNSRPGRIEDMPPYFLGSIVLIKSADERKADVVDGQQRLTTLTILLSAIRANVGAQEAMDITRLLYEKGSQILGTQNRYRLSLRPRDQQYFQEFIQHEDGFVTLTEQNIPLPDSQRNIRDNAKLFHKRLKALSENERARLAQFIVTRCYLVVVATPDLDSAYRIFSILNSRGMDLSATDILKAEIIGGIPLDERDAYTKTWEDREENLGREPFGELFGHIRMVYRKAKPHGTLLKEFKDHVMDSLTPASFIDNILLPMAEIFEEITDASYASQANAEIVNVSLRWINRLEFKDWIPPALAFAVRHRNAPTDMRDFFRDLERLAYGLLINRSGINERIDRFSKLTTAVENGDDLYEDASPLQLTPSEQYKIYATIAGPLYTTLSARARSTVLLRIDALLSSGGATYDYPTITVEHVLPQNPQPNSTWLSWFPDEVIRNQNVHKLGNLALLSRRKNSAASNYEFDRKKEVYFTRNGISPFVLTTQVLGATEWTPAIIAERQETLLSNIDEHWRLQGRHDAMEAALDDILK